MLCWGSWANTQKLASREWRFQLFYWDYAIGVLLLALLLAFTAGSTGDAGRGFLADLAQAESRSLGLAFLGGRRLQPLEHPAGRRHRHRGHGRRLPDRRGPRARPGRDHELPGDAGREPRAALRGCRGCRARHPALGRRLPPAAEPGRAHERQGDRALRRGRAADGLLLPLRRGLDVRRLPQPRGGQARALHRGRRLLGGAAAVELRLEHDRDGAPVRGRAGAPRRLLHARARRGCTSSASSAE